MVSTPSNKGDTMQEFIAKSIFQNKHGLYQIIKKMMKLNMN